jgi:hypothetical protein
MAKIEDAVKVTDGVCGQLPGLSELKAKELEEPDEHWRCRQQPAQHSYLHLISTEWLAKATS